jgi:putative flippase GtrA
LSANENDISQVPEVARQGASFLAVGLVATGLQYLILVALVEFLRWPVVTSSSIGFALSALLNYSLNHRYTFRSDAPHHRAFPKFFSVAAAGLALNALLMDMLANKAMIPYLMSQVICTGIVLIWNFTANRVWTFGLSRRAGVK